jgi:hypothetical protein
MLLLFAVVDNRAYSAYGLRYTICVAVVIVVSPIHIMVADVVVVIVVDDIWIFTDDEDGV